MARELTTEVVIAAAPVRVWSVLTDFQAFPQWAPFFRSVEGELRVGARLKVHFENGFRIAPVVTAAEPGSLFEWKGKLAFGGLFDGRHRFELRPEGAGTRFIHSERFTGLLVPLFGGTLRKTREGFVTFNEALRSRAEAA